MRDPDYQDIPKDSIPVVKISKNSLVKTISGDLILDGRRISGPVAGVNVEPDIFDVSLDNDSLVLPAKTEKSALIYVYEGCVSVGDRNIQSQEMGLLSGGDCVVVSSEVTSRFLFLSAIPLKEPIASWGPFVMNTFDEVDKAIEDFKSGKFLG